MMKVGSEKFDYWWEKSKPFLIETLKKSGGEYTIDDVLEDIQHDQAMFYPVKNGASVFRLAMYPRKRMLRIWLAGGDMHGEFEGKPVIHAVLEAAEYQAKEHNCDGIEVLGRRGWEKILKPYGYEHKRVMLIKELGE
jgi:hypothetical protein